MLTGLGKYSNLGQIIWNPPPFGTNRKVGTGGGGSLALTGDFIKRALRSNDIRAKKKYVTWLVSSTTIEYSTDHTRFAKSKYTGDSTY